MASTENTSTIQPNETSAAFNDNRCRNINDNDVINEAPPSYEASCPQSGSSAQNHLVGNSGYLATISNGQMILPQDGPPGYTAAPLSVAGYPKDPYPLPPYHNIYNSYINYGNPTGANGNANGGDVVQMQAMVDAVIVQNALPNETRQREQSSYNCMIIACKILTIAILSIFFTILFRSYFF